MNITGPATSFGILEIDASSLFHQSLQIAELRKGLTMPAQASRQYRVAGLVIPPIDFGAALATLRAVSIHHVCVLTKRDATVGLGFETEADRQAKQRKQELEQAQHEQSLTLAQMSPEEQAALRRPPADGPAPKKKKVAKADMPAPDASAGAADGAPVNEKSEVAKILDPLCEDSFQSVLDQVGEDYEATGNGYIEVVRDGGKIVSLWHLPATGVRIYNEAQKPFYHYEVQDGTGTVRYARFGELERMRAAVGIDASVQVTELIHFRQPTAMDPQYGLPNWLAAMPWLELAQMMLQYHFDYFQNRAVPDLMVTLTGAKVDEADLKKIRDGLRETVGAKKRFRTMVINMPQQDTEVNVERLQADNRENFEDLWAAVQLQVASAHRVPPLLAGITLPGKMAAANELPNALVAFQTLYLDKHQSIFQNMLGLTLGAPDAGLGLKPEMFKLKKITDAYDLGQLDTMARMKQPVATAQSQGRDLGNGLKS